MTWIANRDLSQGEISKQADDALAPEEPNVYRLTAQVMFDAPAERNVLVDAYIESHISLRRSEET